jgi:putative transposase
MSTTAWARRANIDWLNRFGIIWWRCDVEQPACQRDAGLSRGCGEQAIMPDAVEALWQDVKQEPADKRGHGEDGLIHHSGRGVQYLAMSYTQRLSEAELVPSVGSVGDSYDNALAETINGFYKAEVIWRQRSWPSASAVEMATLRWVDWFNYHRLFGPIGHIPPAAAEANYYAANETLDMVA